MRIPGKEGWQPLPEDPDMVFVRHDGLMMSFMRARQPRLLEFSDKYAKNLEGPTSNAAEVDRWLLTDLQGDVFEQTARELQAAWTDEVIDRTVAQLPKEWQALDKGFLAGALRARRAGLVEYVRRFYRYLARDVDVHLTDRDERVTIATAADGSTTLTVSANGAAPYYSRRFLRGETEEVRVYLHGGNDRVERTGPGGPVHVRIIAGPGAATIQSADTSSEVWTGPGEIAGSRIHRVGPWTNPDPVKDAPWLEPRSYGSWTIRQPIALVAPDVGLAIGGSLTHTIYGFRTQPFASEHTIAAGWSFGASSAKVQYDGTFHRPASSLGYAVRAFASGIEQLNYFGLGNDTPEQPRSVYHSRQTVYSAAPAAQFVFSPRLSVSAGPEIRYVTSGQTAGSLLAQEQPYGTGDFGLVALRGGLRLDTRRVASAALMTAPGAEQGDTPDLVPGTAVFAVVSGFATPAAWDVKDTYGGLDGSIADPSAARIFSSPAVSEASGGSAPTRGSMPHRSAARPTAGTAVIASPATHRSMATSSCARIWARRDSNRSSQSGSVSSGSLMSGGSGSRTRPRASGIRQAAAASWRNRWAPGLSFAPSSPVVTRGSCSTSAQGFVSESWLADPYRFGRQPRVAPRRCRRRSGHYCRRAVRRVRPSGQTTPSFFIRNRSVFGCTPSRSAALPLPLIRQPHRCEHRLDVRALHGVEVVRHGGSGSARAGRTPAASSSCSVSPVEAIIARSTTFSSSRTLPGHE